MESPRSSPVNDEKLMRLAGIFARVGEHVHSTRIAEILDLPYVEDLGSITGAEAKDISFAWMGSWYSVYKPALEVRLGISIDTVPHSPHWRRLPDAEKAASASLMLARGVDRAIKASTQRLATYDRSKLTNEEVVKLEDARSRVQFVSHALRGSTQKSPLDYIRAKLRAAGAVPDDE